MDRGLFLRALPGQAVAVELLFVLLLASCGDYHTERDAVA